MLASFIIFIILLLKFVWKTKRLKTTQPSMDPDLSTKRRKLWVSNMALMNCKKELGQTNMLIIDIIGNNGSCHL